MRDNAADLVLHLGGRSEAKGGGYRPPVAKRNREYEDQFGFPRYEFHASSFIASRHDKQKQLCLLFIFPELRSAELVRLLVSFPR